MSYVLNETLTLQRLAGGQPQRGSIPGSRMSLDLGSEVTVSRTQTVGTGHVAVNLGGSVVNALTYAEVLSEDATVEFGLEIGGVFYPFSEAVRELGTVKLGLIPDTSELFLRASKAGVLVDVFVFHVIGEESS